jgi:hypothetical protein
MRLMPRAHAVSVHEKYPETREVDTKDLLESSGEIDRDHFPQLLSCERDHDRPRILKFGQLRPKLLACMRTPYLSSELSRWR